MNHRLYRPRILHSDHTAYGRVFMDLKTNSDFFSVCSINWFAFITEMECVYCAIRTEPLIIIQVNPSFLLYTKLYCHLFVSRYAESWAIIQI